MNPDTQPTADFALSHGTHTHFAVINTLSWWLSVGELVHMTTGVLLHLTELKGQINVCDRAKGPCHWSIMCVHVSERVLEMMCFYALLLSSELLQRNRLLINSDFWHSEITASVIGHQQKNVRCNCGFYKNCSFSAWTGHMRLNKDIKQDTYLISYLLFFNLLFKGDL